MLPLPLLPAALHEFPTDLFSHKERTEGAVALHVLGVSLPSLPPLSAHACPPQGGHEKDDPIEASGHREGATSSPKGKLIAEKYLKCLRFYCLFLSPVHWAPQTAQQ